MGNKINTVGLVRPMSLHIFAVCSGSSLGLIKDYKQLSVCFFRPSPILHKKSYILYVEVARFKSLNNNKDTTIRALPSGFQLQWICDESIGACRMIPTSPVIYHNFLKASVTIDRLYAAIVIQISLHMRRLVWILLVAYVLRLVFLRQRWFNICSLYFHRFNWANLQIKHTVVFWNPLMILIRR